MAIFGLTKDIQANITKKEDSSIVPLYDSERVNKDILVALPGLQWEVTFLHRQVNEQTLITQYDPDLDLSLQNFVRINNFVIHVDTPLPKGIPDNLTGSGIIDVDFIPTPNDVILSKLPDGRLAMFALTSVARINYNDIRVFKIEYALYTSFENTDDSIYKTLMASIVEQFYYNKDFRLSNTNPLYTKDEFIDRKLYLNYIERLSTFWNNSFITKDTNFYMGYLKDKDKIYDPYMERFIINILGTNNLDKDVELLELDNNDLTILDYTLSTDHLTSRVIKYKDLLSNATLGNNPYLTGIVFSGSFSKIISVTTIDDNTIDIDNDIINVHFPKINTKNYIFRDYIYRVLNGENLTNVLDNLTTFERIYLNMITGNILDKDDIKLAYDNIYNLPKEEQFYFIPIFIYTLKYYLLTFTIKFI